jgi:pimeloyl-ACP methyl ester carboxylesterase
MNQATIQTHHLPTDGALIVFDVRGPVPAADGRPPLLMVGSPMDASGFTTLAAHFTDRTVVTCDPRGLGRSTRTDGSDEQRPEWSAADLHAVVAELGVGPVDVFASSGGAINALALVAAYPDDVATLVAHEPPLVPLLPDADRVVEAGERVTRTYAEKGWGHAMAAFLALTTWRGELTDDFFAQDPPDPAAFGLPTGDDGSRDDPLLSDSSDAVSGWTPDVDAITAAPTRVVVAAGTESEDTLTWRTAACVAAALGQDLAVFPSHHAGFLGGEFGQQGEPEAFAARLREVLDA